MYSPKISVITACKNAKETIVRAIESVRSQSYANIEHVIIDGASSDGTQDVIRNYSNETTKWVSEPDMGISDAFNKGIRLSTGEFHIILNADDTQYRDCISRLVERIGPDIIAVAGHADLKTAAGATIRRFTSTPDLINKKMSLAHNCTLLRTSAFNEIGGYSLDKKIAMDHHLYLRLYRRYGGESFALVDEALTSYYLGGVSDLHAVRGFKEVRDNIIEITGNRIQAWAAYATLLAKHHIASYFNQQQHTS